eukprot:jgi/Undpi1/12484/HiC_scaffold_5.g02155.m1
MAVVVVVAAATAVVAVEFVAEAIKAAAEEDQTLSEVAQAMFKQQEKLLEFDALVAETGGTSQMNDTAGKQAHTQKTLLRERAQGAKRRKRGKKSGMRSSRRRSSDGNLGQVALKARESQSQAGGGVSTAVDLAEILEKKDLSEHETKVIRESMVQSQDKMAVVGYDGVAGGSERRGLGSSTAAAGEVVGNDSMVVGRGIMIKGDVDNCATLIVEGYFEGNYRGGFLAVPKGGKYVGVADVRRADIGGRLHGTLSARTLLEVRSTGKIEGMVRHNDLKIEQGGVMVGDIQKGAKSSPAGA